MMESVRVDPARLAEAYAGLAFDQCAAPSSNKAGALALLEGMGAQLGLTPADMRAETPSAMGQTW
jgi:hypothetical protein